MKKSNIDESRVYIESGEVRVRHILNESGDINMTPHPTECRIFVKDGEVITILSEEIENNDSMSVEMAKVLTLESIKKNINFMEYKQNREFILCNAA